MKLLIWGRPNLLYRKRLGEPHPSIQVIHLVFKLHMHLLVKNTGTQKNGLMTKVRFFIESFAYLFYSLYI